MLVLSSVAVAGAALQAGNHIRVHGELCDLDGVGCGSMLAPLEVAGRWQGSDTVPEALRGAAIGFTAATGLIRETCDGRWTANFGTRIDVDRLALPPSRNGTAATSFASDGGCVDVRLEGVDVVIRGSFEPARLSTAECRVVLAPLRFDWHDTLTVQLRASVDEGAAACGRLVSDSSIAAETLTGAVLDFEGRYDIAFDDLGKGETQDGAVRPDAAGGWIRRAFDAVAMSQTFRLATPKGEASLRFASAPPADDTGSPELTFELSTDERVREALPPDLRSYLNQQGRLDLRWHMDHEPGSVTVNDAVVARAPQRFRMPGRTDVTAECNSDRALSLLFVEADDEGRGDDAQLDAVFAAVDTSSNQRTIAIVFVHGWQHSAAPEDDYVCSFAALIGAVETMEQQAASAARRPPRAVLGIYVGWPGRLYPNETANVVTTFWNRLEVADQIGAQGAALQRVIRGLARQLPKNEGVGADRSNSLVVAGHSLGARAVFGAVRNDIVARTQASLSHLVLLVNPAFSADLYREVHERRCTPGAPVRLFSSLTDQVTRQVYPAGQMLSYRYAARPPVSFLEYILTAANYDEYVTHELTMDPGSNDPPLLHDPQTISRGFLRAPPGIDLYTDLDVPVYRQPTSGRPRPADLWYTMRLESRGASNAGCDETGARVIAVDTRIVPNHGEIFTPPFMEYVVRELNVSLGRAE